MTNAGCCRKRRVDSLSGTCRFVVARFVRSAREGIPNAFGPSSHQTLGSSPGGAELQLRKGLREKVQSTAFHGLIPGLFLKLSRESSAGATVIFFVG